MCRSPTFDTITKRIEKQAIHLAVIATIAERQGKNTRYFAGGLDMLIWAVDNQERVLRGEPMDDDDSESQ
jgi:hypothetical protein